MSTVSTTAEHSKKPANGGVRDSRATPGQDPGGAHPAGRERGASDASVQVRVAARALKVPRQALASLTHGGNAKVALAPLTRSMKQALLKRMGLRQSELTWAGRETLAAYARTLAKWAIRFTPLRAA